MSTSRVISRRASRSSDARRGADARFDARYFRRYYLEPATRVTDAREMQRRACLIAAVLGAAQLPLRRILDLGCGIGLMRPGFRRCAPRAAYMGVESSEYLCRRYGWSRGDAGTFEVRRTVDLLVCYDVLQYLDDAHAALALRRFAKLTHCALYFSALTRRDWRVNCDRSRTDREVYLRSGDWYRRRLRLHFKYLAFGVWVRKNIGVIRWDLES